MRDPYRDPVWLLLPGTRTYPGERAHRVDPFAADVTMCGRQSAAGTVTDDVTGLTQCSRCNHRVGRRRIAARENAERHERMNNTPHRHHESIHAVSGGLPGLGKR